MSERVAETHSQWMSTGSWGHWALLISRKMDCTTPKQEAQGAAFASAFQGLLLDRYFASFYSFYWFFESHPENKHHQDQTYGQVFSLMFVFGERSILGWVQPSWECKEWLKTKHNTTQCIIILPEHKEARLLGTGAIYFVKSLCEMFARLQSYVISW